MVQNPAVRDDPVGRAIEPFHRLLRLVQLGLDLLAITVRSPQCPSRSWTPISASVDSRYLLIAEESDVITALALAVVLTLEVRVLDLVRLEDDVASGDEEEPLGIHVFDNETKCILFKLKKKGTIGTKKKPGSTAVSNDL
jgi:hypothetical protein